jgi:hypothetical protein
MVMEPGMRFISPDLAKLTKSQKNKLLNFKKQKRNFALASTVSVNNANTTCNPNTPSPTTTASHSTSAINCDIRQLLSNSTSRDLSSVPSLIVVDGRTYTLFYCARTYSIHQYIQSPSGSLIDGGEYGGLSGSDDVVLYETLLTVDVTGIVDNTLQQIPVCTVAGLIQTQHGPIKALERLFTPSPSCVILAQLSTLPLIFLVVNNIWKPWMVTSSHCPFILVYLIWICPHLLRSNWTLIPMFSSRQTRYGTLKVSMMNILTLTWTLLMMISNTQTITLVVLMFMVTLFQLPVNMMST